MKARLKRFADNLNFTSTERVVLLVLVGAFVAGLGIMFFRREPVSAPRFDYSASDAEFARRSAVPRGPAGAQAPARRVPGATADSTGPSRVPAARERAPKAGPMVPIDVNSAGKRELMKLPGIGEVIAERIVRYRAEHGAYRELRDLLKVKGIGKKKLEHIAPYCFVEK